MNVFRDVSTYLSISMYVCLLPEALRDPETKTDKFLQVYDIVMAGEVIFTLCMYEHGRDKKRVGSFVSAISELVTWE